MVAICVLVTSIPVAQCFRPQRPTLGYRQVASEGALLRSYGSATASAVSDNSTEYLVIQPPVKVVWDVISEYLVPLCHSWDAKKCPSAVPLLLSCSGGMDSMAMLHALGTIKSHVGAFVRFSSWRRIFGTSCDVDNKLVYITVKTLLDNLHVVYFDHKTRDDTDKDVEVVRAGCDRYGFNMLLQDAGCDVVGLASNHIPGNFQKVARDWRRAEYKRLIRELDQVRTDISIDDSYAAVTNNAKIFNRQVLLQDGDPLIDRDSDSQHFHKGLKGLVFLAHHADDNVETFMFKLLRGVHVSNLTGIEHISYLDEDRDIVLARPFVRVLKDDLCSFLQKVDGEYHEDSSNSSQKYLRNRIRQLVIPELVKVMTTDNRRDVALKCLDKRFRTLSAQSHELHNSIDFETSMFNRYISKKYGLSSSTESPPPGVPTAGPSGRASYSQLAAIYGAFYQSMYDLRYGSRAGDKAHNYVRTLQFLHGIGFNIRDILFLKEWLLVASDLTRKDILYKFCLRALGGNATLDHNILERLSTSWKKEPISDVLKTYYLRSDTAICHQGSLVKVRRPTTSPSAGAMAYDDGKCSFRVFDNFHASVEW